MLKLEAEQAFEFYRSFLEWYCRWHYQAGQPITYLEIGCNRGDTCWRLYPYCKRIDAIDTERFGDWDDPINEEKFPELYFWRMTSTEFFNDYVDKFMPRVTYDLIFIDGDHSQEQVARDIHNSLNHLAPDGLVVLHDTFPPSLSHTGNAACGTAYKAIRYFEEKNQHEYAKDLLQIYTFPVTFGVTLIAKRLVMPWLREPEPILLAGTT